MEPHHGRLRAAGQVGGLLERGAGIRHAATATGFASREDWFAHSGVPEEEWGVGAYLADPDGVRPSISFLEVPESKVAKNRLHLDLNVGGGRDQPLRALS